MDMKLILLLLCHTINERDVMEHEFDLSEAIPIEVSRMLLDDFIGIFVQPTKIFCTSQKKCFLKKK